MDILKERKPLEQMLKKFLTVSIDNAHNNWGYEVS